MLNLPKFNPPADNVIGQSAQGLIVIAESPFNFHEAVVAAKASGFAGHAALIGDLNGSLNELMSGYTVAEVKEQEVIYAATLGRPDITTINNDKNIQLVLLADIAETDKIRAENSLKQLGWKPWKNFTDTKYGSTIVGLTRK